MESRIFIKLYSIALCHVLLIRLPYAVCLPNDNILCVRDVIYNYFIPGQPLFVSLTNTHENAQRILQNVHQFILWPLVMSIPGYVRADVDFSDYAKHGGYLIYTSQNEHEVLELLINQIEEVKKCPCWNPRAKFLIVTSENTSLDLAQEIAQELWTSYKIINLIIMINFNLYTWMPYQSPEVCAKVMVFIVDTCKMSEKTILRNNVSLYPEKIPKFFSGCPLRVTPVQSAYISVVPFINEQNETDYFGIEFEFFKLVIESLNFTLLYRPSVSGDGYYVRLNALADVALGAIDVTFGSIPVHPIAMAYADPTVPYVEEILKWYVPCGKPYGRIEKVFLIFKLSVWVTILIPLILVATFIWIFTRCKSGERRILSGFAKCVFTVWAITIGVSTNGIPRHPSLRIVFLALIWYCFALSTVFQILFTSILVDPGLRKQIENIDELYRSDSIYYYNFGLDSFMKAACPEFYENIPLQKKECTGDEGDCLVEYFTQSNFVIVGFIFYTELYLLGAIPPSKSAPKMCTLNENIYKLMYALHFEKGSPLIGRFNYIIRRLIESGFFDKLFRKMKRVLRYFDWNIINGVDEELDQYFVFEFHHLKLSFYILLIGCIFGFGSLLLENVRGRRLKQHFLRNR
ncbi:Ionotropic receptor 253 [Blattella germanica]|nr:Ionotropic receptor 253 [Blattella germanica]